MNCSLFFVRCDPYSLLLLGLTYNYAGSVEVSGSLQKRAALRSPGHGRDGGS